MDLILSIESSCDDSSIAITDIYTKKLLFHKKNISRKLTCSIWWSSARVSLSSSCYRFTKYTARV